jgi:hypothetical protein
MSLFIASLAFEQGGAAYLGLERLGVLTASLLAGLAGYVVLRIVLGDGQRATGHATARDRPLRDLRVNGNPLGSAIP